MSPYDQLPTRAFWRPAAVDPAPHEISDVYRPRFPITKKTVVATQGSCFAQEIGARLVSRGYRWFEAEPPIKTFPNALSRAYNYGTFSFRTGNIYTPRLLRQWLEWASGVAAPPALGWNVEGGVVDPFRPAVEPGGFASAAEMEGQRARLLRLMAEALPGIDVFVFTLGQTEAWVDAEHEVVFPMCPGTVAGTFQAERHRFVNLGFAACLADMGEAIALLRRFNPAMKVLLTVSPVPMVASASGEHVLTANGRTKSVLRAVAASLVEAGDEGVDYFPSYELLTEPPFRAADYNKNCRTIGRAGVGRVMTEFFRAHGDEVEPAPARPVRRRVARRPERPLEGAAESAEDLVCEEVMLEGSVPR